MKRALGFCTGGIVVLMLAICGFWYWINIPPRVKIPTPVMPNPNGYDYFLRAGKAFVPDEKGVDETTDVNFVEGKQYPVAAKEAWLKQNAKALLLLREGLKYPARQPVVRSLYTNIPEYSRFRGLARALTVESHVRATRYDWDGALQSALDGYHFGNKTVRGGPMIGGMVGVTIRATSLRELGNLVPHANASAAKSIAMQMEKVYEQRYPYYQTLEDEKWCEVAGNLELMNKGSWRLKLIQSYNNALLSEHANPPTWRDNAKILVYSKRKLITDLMQMMDALIEDARQPYRKQKPIPLMGSPLADIVNPVFKNERWIWARCDTYSVIVMTMYALRAYKLDRGHYPENLEMLVPQYLQKIPIDPFDGTKPLCYQLRKGKYLLWSIGLDGIDDHGTPIINKDKTGRSRHSLLFHDSKGDVVAGVTVP